jgi:hypothetical protein
MRVIMFAAAITAMVPAGAQPRTDAPPRSATLARDIGGYALGTPVADVRKRMTLSHVAGETFAGTDGDIVYEFGFTPAGRIFRIATVQKLGRFVPDAEFQRTLTDKLTAKYGPSIHGQPMSWELVEPVTRTSGQTLPTRTMWMDGFVSDEDGEVTLKLTMVDFRILWADEAALNEAPRQRGEDRVRF